MNRGENSLRKGIRPVSDKNEEILVSSDEEQMTPNNKKITLSKIQKYKTLFRNLRIL